MILMPACTDVLCVNCFNDYCRIVIREEGIKRFNCPICGNPNLSKLDLKQDEYLDLFVKMVSWRVV